MGNAREKQPLRGVDKTALSCIHHERRDARQRDQHRVEESA